MVGSVCAAVAELGPHVEFAALLECPYTVCVLLSVPLIFGVLYFLFGHDGPASWYRAMTFLVVASPCAVVISTPARSEEHTSELQSRGQLVCRLLLEKKKILSLRQRQYF